MPTSTQTHPASSVSASTLAMTVLVPTKDRPDMLRACLESILASTHDSFEVIVIDQSATPFLEIHDQRLRLINSSAQGKSAALNEGISVASGRYFAFTDDDCTVSPEWL